MSTRSNAKLNTDHEPIPTQTEHWNPVLCKICRHPCRHLVTKTEDGGTEAKWVHGSEDGTVIQHPDADVVIGPTGQCRHYRDPSNPGRTLCGIWYGLRGRKVRLSDGITAHCLGCAKTQKRLGLGS